MENFDEVIANLTKLYEKGNLLDLVDKIGEREYLDDRYGVYAVKLFFEHFHRSRRPFLNTLETMVSRDMIDRKYLTIAQKYETELNSAIDLEKDFEFTYFGIKTLFHTHLAHITDGNVTKFIESPQDLFMRVSLQIHGDDIKKIIETYFLLSDGYYTHASPTLFNACSSKGSLTSCYLLTLKDDSVLGIADTLREAYILSASGGGIGLSLTDLRSSKSIINSAQNQCQGILPLLSMLNVSTKYFKQSSRRKGAIAIYLEPSHADLSSVLKCKEEIFGTEFQELHFALFVPDLFMKRVINEEMWSFFDREESALLTSVYGSEYEELYERLEKEKKYVNQKPAREIMREICKAQQSTSGPFMVYKDTVNFMSNQKNIGIVKCSNLCTEIYEVCDQERTASCNLASINLTKFVVNDDIDFNKLRGVVREIVFNLDKTIDVNHYTPGLTSVENHNKETRPMGIGVQGLSDAFMKMKIPFDCHKARVLNTLIAENIYFAAIEASVELSRKFGPYMYFDGCPLSRGLFHFDLFDKLTKTKTILTLEWDELKRKIMKYGVRNSLFCAWMPTVSTSPIFGNYECFEPISGNIMTRKTSSGTYTIVNKYLQKDLKDLNLWTEDTIHSIVNHNGSIQHLNLPIEIKNIYKTAFEISMKTQIEMAVARTPFVDQGQSFSFNIATPTIEHLMDLHIKTWESRLPTGMYYLRTLPATQTSGVVNTFNQCEVCSA